MNNDNIIKIPGNNIRQDIEELRKSVENLTLKLALMEQFNEQTMLVICEFTKSHNGSLEVTQRIFKALARSIDDLQLRIKDMETKKPVG